MPAFEMFMPRQINLQFRVILVVISDKKPGQFLIFYESVHEIILKNRIFEMAIMWKSKICIN